MSSLNLVTGGAGFIGSNLVKKLLDLEEKVICLDDLSSGNFENIVALNKNKNFTFQKCNVLEDININENIDRIWHFACPASPYYFLKDPINTSKIAFIGTYKMLELAQKNNAKILIASSSEIYGMSEVCPQVETYNGNINVISNRSCYAEGKRLAETIAYDYYRKNKLDVKVARIFNTYGPNLQIKDKRVISNFIVNALRDHPLVINGKGFQTRSFCYITDLIEGLIKLMDSNFNGPFNLGNVEEIKIIDLAKIIIKKTKSKSILDFSDLSEYETLRRVPSIDQARNFLNWKPSIDINQGLDLTIEFFKKAIKNKHYEK